LSTPVEDPYYPSHGDPGVDALHYGLDLRWSRATRVLHGTARITLRVTSDTDRVTLDLGKPLTVAAVSLDGAGVSWTRSGNHLLVDTPPLVAGTRHHLTVVYHGTPHPVTAPTSRSDLPYVGWHTTGTGAVWTMQEPFGAFTWYPVNDQPSDKAFYDARIDVPGDWVGIFNGRLVHRRTTAGRTVTLWHLGSPAASYLTTIAIGDYRGYRDTGPHGLPIRYWVHRGDTSTLSELRRTPGMIRWLERRLGPYPFSRIGTVVVPSLSGMETQTLVTMGGKLLRDYPPREFRSDLLHEYAHQWYGDTVTPDNWPDLWLNESFAMYTQFRWEVSQGWRTMADVRDELDSLDAQLRAEDGPPGAYFPQDFADTCVYYCGARMLDRLRSKLGAATFDSAWRAWPQRHRWASVDRGDYISWLDYRTGRSLDSFFTTWLTSPTSPP
jgi:aminopeptidase N